MRNKACCGEGEHVREGMSSVIALEDDEVGDR